MRPIDQMAPMTPRRSVAHGVWPLALSLISLGAVAEQGATECLAHADDRVRLACYDRLHGRSALTPVPQPAPVTAASPSDIAGGSAPAPVPRAGTETLLSQRWDLDGQRSLMFAPRAHQPVYILPATWTDRVNRSPASPAALHSVTDPLELKAVEVKYQLSLKAKFGENLLGTPLSLWGAYTQSSRWQVYNGAASRPFRETNYEPELILVWPLRQALLGWDLRLASLSLNHQSNGRSLPLSRSWNRVIASAAFERGEWVAEVSAWRRLRENPADDDNPDIQNFIGRGELHVGRYWGDHAVSLQLRHSLRGSDAARGSAQFDWVFPISGALHGYFQLFSGYGESLVDYNLRQNKLGLGVTIAGWR